MIGVAVLALVTVVFASRWPRGTAWALLVVLPFQVALNPFPDIDLLLGRIIIPFVALGLLFALWRERLSVRCSPLLWIGLFVATIGTASSLWALDSIAALQRSLVWWSLLPMIVIGEWLFSFKEERDRLPSVLGILIGSVSAVALIPVGAAFLGGRDATEAFIISLAPLLWGHGLGGEVIAHPSWFVEIGGSPVLRAFLPFPDPHMLAFFLAATVPFVAFHKTAVARIATVAGVSALLLTFARGGYLGFVAAFLVALPFAWRSFSFGLRRILVGVLALLVVVVVLPNPFSMRLWSSFDLSEGSVAGRTETMREALAVVSRVPLLGVGLGNYASVVAPLAPPESPLYAHNTYLDLASEVGVPVVITLVLSIGVVVLRRRSFSLHFSYGSLQYAALLAFIWFSVHAFFETPLFSPRVVPYFFIVLVLLLTRPHNYETSA